jgi:hypothetical protein
MYSEEDNRKDHVEWMKDPKKFSSSRYNPYIGKTVEKICGYGNGEIFIFFTDGKIIQFSVDPGDHQSDLYNKTEEVFNFSTWKYREQEEYEKKNPGKEY